MSLYGPVLVLAAVGLLALVLRWTYGTPRPVPPTRRDFGLLRPVSVVDDSTHAAALRAVLNDSGIRSTVSRTEDGQMVVLVFADDVDVARQVLGPR